MEYYSNKVVLVTGATSGIGLSIVRQLSEVRTCQVIASGRSSGKLREVQGSLSSKIHTVVIDFERDDEIIATAVQKAIAIHGRIDMVINCVGMGFRGQVQDTSMSVHRRILQVDYFGQVAMIKAVLESWRDCQSPSPRHIIQVSSVQGYIGLGDRAPYSAAKHALVGFIDSLRAEVDTFPSPSSDIRVTLVCPGYVRTDHSANAITGDGSVYGKEDDSTAAGDSPESVAQSLLFRAAKGDREIILADSKITTLIMFRFLFPLLCFRIHRNRFIGAKEKIWKSILKWLFGY
jgi:dehydrogenase/reductase SDR family member 7B